MMSGCLARRLHRQTVLRPQAALRQHRLQALHADVLFDLLALLVRVHDRAHVLALAAAVRLVHLGRIDRAVGQRDMRRRIVVDEHDALVVVTTRLLAAKASLKTSRSCAMARISDSMHLAVSKSVVRKKKNCQKIARRLLWGLERVPRIQRLAGRAERAGARRIV
jgi:hypothetical protein